MLENNPAQNLNQQEFGNKPFSGHYLVTNPTAKRLDRNLQSQLIDNGHDRVWKYVRSDMKKLIFQIIVVAVGVLALAAYTQAYFFTNICIVTGTIQFHGKLADQGLSVAAYISQDKVAESLTGDNGSFELKIPEYDQTKPAIKGYKSPNDIIQVKLDGRNAKPTFSPASENLRIDLKVDQQSLDVKLSTWGKIKALFK